jgi:hypothetical protein
MRRTITVAILTLALALPAFALFESSALVETDTFRKSTVTKTFQANIADNATGAKVRYRFNLKSGEAVVKLLDAKGATKWENTLQAGKHNLEEKVAGATGVALVRIELRDATGNYTVKVTGY